MTNMEMMFRHSVSGSGLQYIPLKKAPVHPNGKDLQSQSPSPDAHDAPAAAKLRQPPCFSTIRE
jgi:hypothetical protein